MKITEICEKAMQVRERKRTVVKRVSAIRIAEIFVFTFYYCYYGIDKRPMRRRAF